MLIDENGEVIPPGKVRGYWCKHKYLTVPEGESMVVELPEHETDINSIVDRFARTGYLPESNRVPQYGDVTGLQIDLTEALNKSQETLSKFHDFAQNWEETSGASAVIGPKSDENTLVSQGTDNV